MFQGDRASPGAVLPVLGDGADASGLGGHCARAGAHDREPRRAHAARAAQCVSLAVTAPSYNFLLDAWQ